MERAALPEEILLIISRYLNEDRCYRSLSRLSFACRAIYELLYPLRHQHLDLHSAKACQLLRNVPVSLEATGQFGYPGMVGAMTSELDAMFGDRQYGVRLPSARAASTLKLVRSLTFNTHPSMVLKPDANYARVYPRSNHAIPNLRNILIEGDAIPHRADRTNPPVLQRLFSYFAPESLCVKLEPNLRNTQVLRDLYDHLYESDAWRRKHKRINLHGISNQTLVPHYGYATCNVYFDSTRCVLATNDDQLDFNPPTLPRAATTRSEQIAFMVFCLLGFKTERRVRYDPVAPIRLYGALDNLDWRMLEPGARAVTDLRERMRIRVQLRMPVLTALWRSQPTPKEIDDAYIKIQFLPPPPTSARCPDCGFACSPQSTTMSI